MIPISLCIITKNEAPKLRRCLEHVKDYPFEIIVVDTGSTDDSVEVAKEFTQNIYHFDWVNDFAKARNFSISKATHDWILVLDTDEYVTELDLDAMYQLMEQNPTGIGRLLRTSYDTGNNVMQDRVERLFRKDCYHYYRPIHEQVTPIHDTPYSLFLIPLYCDHDGYVETGELTGSKAKRDLKILLDSLEEYKDSYSYHQIGQCYYILEDFPNAIAYYEQGISFDLDPNSEYVQIMIVNYGQCLIKTNQTEKALAFFKQIYSLFENYADFVYTYGVLQYLTGNLIQAGMEFLRATTLTDFKIVGCNSFRAYHMLGMIYAQLGDRDLTQKFFEKAGDYPPAKEALSELLKNHPKE